MELTTGTVVDRYTVQSILGEGGMAVVYLCRHTQLGTLHALKVLSMTSRAIRERLVQEGRVQAQLRHPNIVAVTDVITLNGAPGLVMEYIEGPSLDELIDQKPLTYDQIDVLAEGILSGVAHAHAQGLIHRDLKPANIMLALRGSMLVPKIMDFGLAKLLEGDNKTSSTRTGSTMGTPHYMSPEQVTDSKNVDHRTDVFALGAILYEMLCAKRAFGGENLLQIFSAVAQAKYTPPRELKPDLPRRMEAAIMGALEPDRDKRIQTTDALLRVWKGESEHTATTEPEAPAGPFSADFLSSVSRTSSPGSDPDRSSGTWAGTSHIESAPPAVSVETLHQGPPVEEIPPPPVLAPAEAAPVPEVPATSLVSGRSLVMGGGAAFMLAAVVGGLALAVVGAVGLGYATMGGDSRPRRTPDPVQVEPDGPRDPAAVDPVPTKPTKPGPKVKPTRPSSKPTRPKPTKTQPAPQPDPVAVVDPVPDPDGVDPDAVDPDAVDPDGVDPDAVDPDAVDPDAVDPDSVEPEAASGVDARLTDPDSTVREARVRELENVPTASAVLVRLAREDPSRDVQVAAWQMVCSRYSRGVGDRLIQEALLLQAIRTGVFSEREAASAYGEQGTDLSVLEPLVTDRGAVQAGTAANAMVKIAARQGQQAEVRAFLEEQIADEDVGFVKGRALKSALNKL